MSFSIGSAHIDLTARDRGMTAGLARVQAAAAGLATKLAAVAAAAKWAMLGLGAGAGFGVKLAGDFEQAEVAMEVMLGSAAKAKKMMADLTRFAAETPFQLPELAKAAKLLLAFNEPAEQVVGTLRRIGDIASAIGAPVGEIAELYGKARVQGRLFAQDINQLTGRGIPIIQELAKIFGVADSKVRKLVEDGKIGFPAIERAFINLTSEGGRFAGMMERQSRTFNGVLSTLMDNVGAVARAFGKMLLPTLKRWADAINAALPGIEAWIEKNSRLVLTAAGVGAGLLALIALGPRIIGTINAVVGAITFAAANPMIALLAAIAAVGAALVLSGQEGDTWGEKMQSLASGASSLWSGVLPNWRDAAEWIQSTLKIVSFAFLTMRDSAEIAIFKVGALLYEFGERVAWVFTGVIWPTLKWAVQNFGDVLTDFFNGIITGVKNAAKNVWEAAKSIITGKDANYVSLDDGFEAKTSAPPPIQEFKSDSFIRDEIAAMEAALDAKARKYFGVDHMPAPPKPGAPPAKEGEKAPAGFAVAGGGEKQKQEQKTEYVGLQEMWKKMNASFADAQAAQAEREMQRRQLAAAEQAAERLDEIARAILGQGLAGVPRFV